MPSQQRFEGPELEQLVDDVRHRYGDDVAIVEANKVRRGGVGGFFARELFEVVVEVDDENPARTPSGPRTLMDLVDAVDDGPEPQFYDVEKTDDLEWETLASPETVEALLDQLDETRSRGRAPVPQTTVSTDGDAFADVLRRIAHSTEEPTRTPASAAADDEPFRSFADDARRAASSSRRAPAPARASEPGPRTPVRGQRPRNSPSRPATPGLALDRRQLAELGLPADVLDRPLRATDRISALLELAESFPRPRPLPTGPDAVIALVGDRSAMEHAVAWVNEQLGLAPDRLMLATRNEEKVFPLERRIADHDRAAELRRSWRRRSTPVLVAVDAPVGLRHTTWTRHVLDALEPAAVWAVVDAQRKPEDVVAWGERIGGVDAVAIDRTGETASPAAILTTGLPVSLLDGHAATPARWAAVLDERLLAA